MEDLEKLELRDTDKGVIIPVKVVPASSRHRIVGVLAGRLKITTSSPAEKGKANKAVSALLADALGLSRRDVSLVSGQVSSRKEFLIVGLGSHQVRLRLERIH